MTVASIFHLISFISLAFTMPTTSRIDWVVRQMASGRKVHVAVGAAKDTSKCKVKIILQNANAGAMEQGAAAVVQSVLTHVRGLAQQYSSMDRGHKHSSGISEICIWLSVGKLPAPPDGGVNDGEQHAEVEPSSVRPPEAGIPNMAQPIQPPPRSAAVRESTTTGGSIMDMAEVAGLRACLPPPQPHVPAHLPPPVLPTVIQHLAFLDHLAEERASRSRGSGQR